MVHGKTGSMAQAVRQQAAEPQSGAKQGNSASTAVVVAVCIFAFFCTLGFLALAAWYVFESYLKPKTDAHLPPIRNQAAPPLKPLEPQLDNTQPANPMPEQPPLKADQPQISAPPQRSAQPTTHKGQTGGKKTGPDNLLEHIDTLDPSLKPKRNYTGDSYKYYDKEIESRP